MANVVCADVLAWAAGYAGEPFHACLCDPPYSLGNGKRGFMNKVWDTGIAFQPETWRAIAEHILPGGFLMAFGGSRTYHRLAVAAEDAGLIVHPAIVWLQGQGFPKASRVDDKIDKAAGAEREKFVDTQWLERYPNGPGGNGFHGGVGRSSDGSRDEPQMTTAPATPLAQTWAGHRYGLQALKPCAEFILCAQKPYEGKPVDSITRTGAGAYWVDGARVASEQAYVNAGIRLPSNKAETCYGQAKGQDDSWHKFPGNSQGRWPPNVVLSHLPGCERVGVRRVRGNGNQDGGGTGGIWSGVSNKPVSPGYADADGMEAVDEWVCVEGCPVKALGEMSGERKSGYRPKSLPDHAGDDLSQGLYQGGFKRGNHIGINDHGTAARFYPQSDWQYEIEERIAGVTPFMYQAKSARSERDQGLSGVVRLRSDLSEEKKKWVLQELQKAGVSPLG